MITQEFREKIESFYGNEILYSRDCKLLSESLFEKTGRLVSPTTLKRALGFTSSHVKPSLFTLDALAVFCEYDDFDDAVHNQFSSNKHKTASDIDWSFLQKEAEKVTLKTLASLKRSSGVLYQAVIHRQFSEDFVEEFLSSDKSASALVAPGGYGKTITLCKLIEKFWVADNPKYSNDIVWLISAVDLARQLRDVKDYGEFITKTFSPGNQPVENVQEYLDLVKVNPKGKIIIIVDGFDEITKRNDLQKQTFWKIAEYVSSIKDLEYCKFILTMRTSSWKNLTSPLKGKEDLTSCWHGVNFDNYGESYANIPLLNTEEINKITRNYCSLNNIDASSILYERMTYRLQEIISQPFYLQLFLQSYKSKKKKFINRLDLIEYYIREHVFAGQYGEEKLDLIKQFCHVSDFARQGFSVEKSKLNLVKDYKKAYDELLSFGVFQEEKVINKFHTFSILVSFSHTIYTDYFLAIHWIEHFGGVSQRLFQEVAEFYEGYDFREYILNWIILIAIQDGGFKSLKGLFSLPLTHFELSRIGEMLGFYLRDYEIQAEELFKHFAKDPLSRLYFYNKTVDTDYLILQYENRLDTYLNYVNNESERLGALSMKAFARFLSLDKKGLMLIKEELDALHFDLKKTHPIFSGRYYGLKILIDRSINNTISQEVLEDVFKAAKNVPLAPDDMLHFPCFHFHILEAFVICGYPKESMQCIEMIKDQYPKFDENHQSGLFQIMGAYVAWTVAKLGDVDEALQMIESIDTRFFGVKVRNYFHIELDLIWSSILLMKGRPVAAIPKLQSVVDRSRAFKYKWSECNALYMLGNCYGGLGEKELGHDYCRQADELNEDKIHLTNQCECQE